MTYLKSFSSVSICTSYLSTVLTCLLVLLNFTMFTTITSYVYMRAFYNMMPHIAKIMKMYFLFQRFQVILLGSGIHGIGKRLAFYHHVYHFLPCVLPVPSVVYGV